MLDIWLDNFFYGYSYATVQLCLDRSFTPDCCRPRGCSTSLLLMPRLPDDIRRERRSREKLDRLVMSVKFIRDGYLNSRSFFSRSGHVITCAFQSEIRVGAGAAREGAEQPAARHNVSRFGSDGHSLSSRGNENHESRAAPRVSDTQSYGCIS